MSARNNVAERLIVGFTKCRLSIFPSFIDSQGASKVELSTPQVRTQGGTVAADHRRVPQCKERGGRDLPARETSNQHGLGICRDPSGSGNRPSLDFEAAATGRKHSQLAGRSLQAAVGGSFRDSPRLRDPEQQGQEGAGRGGERKVWGGR